MTDGCDNKSIKHCATSLALCVNQQRKNGIHCQFLAANMDARFTGTLYGFDDGNSLQVDADAGHFKAAMMAATSSAEKACRGAPPSLTQFTPMMRRVSSDSSYQYSPTPYTGTVHNNSVTAPTQVPQIPRMQRQ